MRERPNGSLHNYFFLGRSTITSEDIRLLWECLQAGWYACWAPYWGPRGASIRGLLLIHKKSDRKDVLVLFYLLEIIITGNKCCFANCKPQRRMVGTQENTLSVIRKLPQ